MSVASEAISSNEMFQGIHRPEEEKEEEKEEDVEQQSLDEIISVQPRDGDSNTKTNENEPRVINKDFRDVYETGRWGSISTTDRLLVFGGTVVAVVLAIVIVVAVLLINSRDNGSEKHQQTNAMIPSPAPTLVPTFAPVSKSQQLEKIFSCIGNLTSTKDSLEDLPLDEDFYVDLYKDPLQPPYVRAMSWVIYGDSRSDELHWLPQRYALATLYYATGGPNWNDNSNWLSEAHACDWFGVLCDSRRTVMEQLDLQSNNLENHIPNEIALLSSVKSLWFRRNRLTGILRAQPFNDLPQLQHLYLETNQFSGSIPSNLTESIPPLTTLFLHQNLFTGTFPLEFCSGPGQSPILGFFGVDCDRNACACCFAYNCF